MNLFNTELPARIAFHGRRFSFSGLEGSLYRQAAALLEKRGGIMDMSPTLTTDYMVIRPQDGRKPSGIYQAQELKRRGSAIVLLLWEDFLYIASHPAPRPPLSAHPDKDGFVTDNRGRLFGYCGRRKKITIPNGVVSIEAGAFLGQSITELRLPASVKKICYRAFCGCSALHSVFFSSDGSPVVETEAFRGCSELETLRIPSAALKAGAFADCGNLKNVMLLCRVSPAAFCVNPLLLPDFSAPAAVREHLFRRLTEEDRAKTAAFWLAGTSGCEALPLTALSEYIRKKKSSYAAEMIEQDDAAGMQRLLSLYRRLPMDTLQDWMEAANEEQSTAVSAVLLDYSKDHFSREQLEQAEQDRADKALGLKDLTVADWRKIFRFAYTGDGIELRGYCGEDTSLLIPEFIGTRPVVSIGWGAFRNSAIDTLTVSETVEHIGAHAFENCKALSDVYVPDTLEDIGERAFAGCRSMADETGLIALNGRIFGFVGDRYLPHFPTQDTKLCCSLQTLPYLTARPAAVKETVLPPSPKVGEAVFFGHFPQNPSLVPEPVCWRVLECDEESCLLLSEKGLAAIPFHRRDADTDWNSSNLRLWLNTVFAEYCFDSEELSLLLPVTVETPDSEAYGTPGGNTVTDRVYLLSEQEAARYLPTPAERRCEATAYAAQQGAWINSDGFCWWWLRTPGSDSQKAARVFSYGDINCLGDHVTVGTHTIRPVIRLRLNRQQEGNV